MEIGLYFGSFNPIHHGHLIIASHVAEQTSCDQVWLVVTPQNPLKKQSSLIHEAHRKHLIDLAIEEDDRLRSSNIEFKLPKPSFTIDTLTHLKETYPKHTFKVIMGSDAFTNIKKWKNWELLINSYEIYIYERPGFPISLHGFPNGIKLINAPLLQISSTMVREMIRQGRSIRYYVPDIVAEEILNQGFYT